MSVPAITRLKMMRGDTRVLDATITDPGLNGDPPVSLVNVSLWFTAKRSKSDADSAAIFQKTINNGIGIVSAPAGTITIAISPTDTSGLAISAKDLDLYWDLQLGVGSDIFTVAQGILTIVGDVTLTT